MKKKLLTILTSLCIGMFASSGFVNAEDAAEPNSPTSYISDRHLTIEDVIPENMDYELLSEQDLKKNSDAKKVKQELTSLAEDNGVVVESVKIYKVTPKNNNANIQNDADCNNTSEKAELAAATCNYQSALSYTASATTYRP